MAGWFHSVLLRSDGKANVFGRADCRDHRVEFTPREGAQRFVAVGAGLYHTLLLSDDGRLENYGCNGVGQGTPPQLPPRSRYVGVTAGEYHSVAWREDGNALAFGNNFWGQCDIPALPHGMRYVSASAGMRHTLLVMNNGTVVACGQSADDRCKSPALPSGVRYTAAAAGGRHSLLIRSDGEAVAFGCNADGETDVPPLPTGMSYTFAAAGGSHSVLIRSDGKAIAFGANTHGQCEIPVLVPGTWYVHASAGYRHTLLVRSDGVAVAVGWSVDGQCAVPDLPEGALYIGPNWPTPNVWNRNPIPPESPHKSSEMPEEEGSPLPLNFIFGDKSAPEKPQRCDFAKSILDSPRSDRTPATPSTVAPATPRSTSNAAHVFSPRPVVFRRSQSGAALLAGIHDRNLDWTGDQAMRHRRASSLASNSARRSSRVGDYLHSGRTGLSKTHGAVRRPSRGPPGAHGHTFWGSKVAQKVPCDRLLEHGGLMKDLAPLMRPGLDQGGTFVSSAPTDRECLPHQQLQEYGGRICDLSDVMRPGLRRGSTIPKIGGSPLDHVPHDQLKEYGGHVSSLAGILRPDAGLLDGTSAFVAGGLPTSPRPHDFLEEYGGRIEDVSTILRPGLRHDSPGPPLLDTAQYVRDYGSLPTGSDTSSGARTPAAALPTVNACPRQGCPAPVQAAPTNRHAKSPIPARTRTLPPRSASNPRRSCRRPGSPECFSRGSSPRKHKVMTWSRRYQILENAIHQHIAKRQQADSSRVFPDQGFLRGATADFRR